MGRPLNSELLGTWYKSPTWNTWRALKGRCNNPKAKDFKWYGGRGISYPDKWESFYGFLEDMGERPEGCTLDRIDSDKAYSKENCRWATVVQQRKNMSSNVFVTIGGKRKILRDWMRELDLNSSTVYYRIRKGMTPYEALTTPISSSGGHGKWKEPVDNRSRRCPLDAEAKIGSNWAETH